VGDAEFSDRVSFESYFLAPSPLAFGFDYSVIADLAAGGLNDIFI
jgi:hypothetical protein